MIYLDKPLTADNGAVVGHHAVRRVELAADADALVVLIESWPSQARRIAGDAPLARMAFRLPLAAMSGSATLVREIANALAATPPLDGALRTQDLGATLAGAKLRQWQAIKARRDQIEFGGFAWDGSALDSDAVSQDHIQGAVLMAMIAERAGQPFSIEWTLADNAVRALSGSEMIAVGLALGAHVRAAHETARALRQQIADAATISEVEAVVWPA